MMINKGISIYVHIPFCISKCKYCSFYSIEKKNTEDLQIKYFEALKNTALYFSRLINPQETVVETVYFGGGTPTSVDVSLLGDFLLFLKAIFNFSKECEVTFETNPKTISEDNAFLLKSQGFTRASLGIQTTNNELLKKLGRVHSFEDGVEAYGILKNAGFNNISVDLMYGLMGTSLSDVATDVENLLKLDPEHISSYALSIEKNTPLYFQKKNYIFPDDDLQAEMYLKICEILSENNYSHYEISNFAKKGFESKHNLGYWNRRDYIGIGASAHSLLNGKRFSSMNDITSFISEVHAEHYSNAFGLDEAEILSEDDIKEEEIMLSLRTSAGISISSLSPQMKKFVESGLAKYQNGSFSLTDKGFFVSNSIIYYLCKELLYDKR